MQAHVQVTALGNRTINCDIGVQGVPYHPYYLPASLQAPGRLPHLGLSERNPVYLDGHRQQPMSGPGEVPGRPRHTPRRGAALPL